MCISLYVAAGSFSGDVNAGWRVRPDGRVDFALSSTNERGYLGLGISNDNEMVRFGLHCIVF